MSFKFCTFWPSDPSQDINQSITMRFKFCTYRVSDPKAKISINQSQWALNSAPLGYLLLKPRYQSITMGFKFCTFWPSDPSQDSNQSITMPTSLSCQENCHNQKNQSVNFYSQSNNPLNYRIRPYFEKLNI